MTTSKLAGLVTLVVVFITSSIAIWVAPITRHGGFSLAAHIAAETGVIAVIGFIAALILYESPY